jgi:hypothetical protein
MAASEDLDAIRLVSLAETKADLPTPLPSSLLQSLIDPKTDNALHP